MKFTKSKKVVVNNLKNTIKIRGEKKQAQRRVFESKYMKGDSLKSSNDEIMKSLGLKKSNVTSNQDLLNDETKGAPELEIKNIVPPSHSKTKENQRIFRNSILNSLKEVYKR